MGWGEAVGFSGSCRVVEKFLTTGRSLGSVVFMREIPPEDSHLSHLAASFFFSLPRPSRPFSHSSAVALPIDLTPKNSRLISSTCDLRKNLVICTEGGGAPPSRAVGETTYNSFVRKTNGSAAINGDGIDDDRSKSIS